MRWASRCILVLGTFSFNASAYCRTTTCTRNTTNPACDVDSEGCAVTGAPLYWPDSTMDLAVFPEGSVKRGISAETTKNVVRRALSAWTTVECDGTDPSMAVGDVRVLTDAEVGDISERLTGDDDAHLGIRVLRFHDLEWPYPAGGHDVALTTTTYGTKDGRIYGTDIELNSANHNFTAGDAAADFDLLSVLTHESGHVFGLDDLPTPGATMFGAYHGGGDLSPRTLSSDDVAGMCAIYPPGRFPSDDDAGGCTCRVDGRSGFVGVLPEFACLATVLVAFARKGASSSPIRRS